MYVYESDLIHFGLNLTSLMKKTFQCKGGDIFRIQDLQLCRLCLHNTSLSTVNVSYFQYILQYIENLQKELERNYQREITYQEIREALRIRKNKSLDGICTTKLKGGRLHETTALSIK